MPLNKRKQTLQHSRSFFFSILIKITGFDTQKDVNEILNLKNVFKIFDHIRKIALTKTNNFDKYSLNGIHSMRKLLEFDVSH